MTSKDSLFHHQNPNFYDFFPRAIAPFTGKYCFTLVTAFLIFLFPISPTSAECFRKSRLPYQVWNLHHPKIPVTCPSWQPSPDHIFPSVDVAATAVASADSIVLICLLLLAMISFWRSCKNSICFISRIILVPRPPHLVCQL